MQWAIGAVSMFYWAIGILPFKDGFYSSTNKQTGGASEGPELNPGMTYDMVDYRLIAECLYGKNLLKLLI